MLRFSICSVIVFLDGFVVCSNLSRLVDTNPNYEASWGKVAFAVLVAVFFAGCAWNTLQTRRTFRRG